eukprot:scaffold811_cov229-Prasinococcus_capsulatus_cf.AAC.1
MGWKRPHCWQKRCGAPLSCTSVALPWNWQICRATPPAHVRAHAYTRQGRVQARTQASEQASKQARARGTVARLLSSGGSWPSLAGAVPSTPWFAAAGSTVIAVRARNELASELAGGLAHPSARQLHLSPPGWHAPQEGEGWSARGCGEGAAQRRARPVPPALSTLRARALASAALCGRAPRRPRPLVAPRAPRPP